MRIRGVSLIVVLCLAIGGLCAQDKAVPKDAFVKKMSITFHQVSDDKDWDTQVRTYVVCNGHNVAKLECCSADRDKDHWKDPGDETRVMTLLQSEVTRLALNQCSVSFGSQASHGAGNDKWVFSPTLHAEFTDDTIREWTFPETTLASAHGSLVTHAYNLADHPKP